MLRSPDIYILVFLQNPQISARNYIYTITDWKDIYLLSHKTSINTKYHSFQYQILNNVLYLNKLFSNLEKLNPHFIQFASH